MKPPLEFKPDDEACLLVGQQIKRPVDAGLSLNNTTLFTRDVARAETGITTGTTITRVAGGAATTSTMASRAGA